ncbi:MAG: hypothetical protein KTR22_02450 [Flavobacteriaceae bacterium]|nr:hypothetical protein [Flavobacteriaceae bacterium]
MENNVAVQRHRDGFYLQYWSLGDHAVIPDQYLKAKGMENNVAVQRHRDGFYLQ